MMFRKFLLPMALVLALSLPVAGAENPLSKLTEGENLEGICVMAVPENGTLLLGNRAIRSGDILTAAQVDSLTFLPEQEEADTVGCLSYLPVYEDSVGPETTLTFSIRGKQNLPPTAEDMTMETYKNLPNTASFRAKDPEGEAVTYAVLRQPKRGTVTLDDQGGFTYTPKKNKVGVDSFTYTATDPAGNVSREATVTIQILKSSAEYTDTETASYRFEAEWLRNTGIFQGESLAGQLCFQGEEPVSRREFLTMLLKELSLPTESDVSAINRDVPEWFKPYLAAAIRSGLTAGLPEEAMAALEDPVTGAEAAVMLQNILDLPVENANSDALAMDAAANSADSEPLTADTAAGGTDSEKANVPAWAKNALAALAAQDVTLNANEKLTRGRAAQILYRVDALYDTAPGTAVFRQTEDNNKF